MPLVLTIWRNITTEELEALALPDFDDPNIDKDAALQGILGKLICLPNIQEQRFLTF